VDKKIFLIILLVVLAIIISLPLRKIKLSEELLPKGGKLSKVVCNYPVTVAGQSMESTLKAGSRVIFNHCIEHKNKLEPEIIIVYKLPGGKMKIGRIKEKLEDSRGLFYKVGQDRREGIDEVFMDSIVAVYQQ